MRSEIRRKLYDVTWRDVRHHDIWPCDENRMSKVPLKPMLVFPTVFQKYFFYHLAVLIWNNRYNNNKVLRGHSHITTSLMGVGGVQWASNVIQPLRKSTVWHNSIFFSTEMVLISYWYRIRNSSPQIGQRYFFRGISSWKWHHIYKNQF